MICKEKIKAWLKSNYPNLTASVRLGEGGKKSFDEIINDCLQDIGPKWISVDNLPIAGRYDVIGKSNKRFTNASLNFDNYTGENLVWYTSGGEPFAKVHEPKFWMHIPELPND